MLGTPGTASERPLSVGAPTGFAVCATQSSLVPPNPKSEIFLNNICILFEFFGGVFFLVCFGVFLEAAGVGGAYNIT